MARLQEVDIPWFGWMTDPAYSRASGTIANANVRRAGSANEQKAAPAKIGIRNRSNTQHNLTGQTFRLSKLACVMSFTWAAPARSCNQLIHELIEVVF